MTPHTSVFANSSLRLLFKGLKNVQLYELINMKYYMANDPNKHGLSGYKSQEKMRTKIVQPTFCFYSEIVYNL